MTFVNFLKKFLFFFLQFLLEFQCSNISAVTEHTQNQIFLASCKKFFFFKMFTLVLIDGFLHGFLKFQFIIVKISILTWYFYVLLPYIIYVMQSGHFSQCPTFLSQTAKERDKKYSVKSP